MFFEGNAVIGDVWAHHSDFNKSKMQSVGGRSYHSLSLRLSGEVVFDIGGKRACSRANGITFMPAGLSYKTEVREGGSMMLIHFRTHKKSGSPPPCICENNDPTVKQLFTQLCESYTADGANNYRCMALLYTLLDLLERPLQPVPKRIRTAKNTIDKDFSRPLTVTLLAKAAKMSDVHLRNEFKKHFGVSPLAYLKSVRIAHAKHLLRSGYHTVTEVALACGFESTSYFSYEFKRLTGVTPSEYTKK